MRRDILPSPNNFFTSTPPLWSPSATPTTEALINEALSNVDAEINNTGTPEKKIFTNFSSKIDSFLKPVVFKPTDLSTLYPAKEESNASPTGNPKFGGAFVPITLDAQFKAERDEGASALPYTFQGEKRHHEQVEEKDRKKQKRCKEKKKGKEKKDDEIKKHKPKFTMQASQTDLENIELKRLREMKSPIFTDEGHLKERVKENSEGEFELSKYYFIIFYDGALMGNHFYKLS